MNKNTQRKLTQAKVDFGIDFIKKNPNATVKLINAAWNEQQNKLLSFIGNDNKRKQKELKENNTEVTLTLGQKTVTYQTRMYGDPKYHAYNVSREMRDFFKKTAMLAEGVTHVTRKNKETGEEKIVKLSFPGRPTDREVFKNFYAGSVDSIVAVSMTDIKVRLLPNYDASPKRVKKQ